MKAGDYWRLFLARGFLACWAYFRNVHWFDMRFRISTARPVYSRKVLPDPSFEFGVHYAPAWTSVVQEASDDVLERYPESALGTWIDLGSGRGKVLAVWTRLFRQRQPPVRLMGVEYDPELALVSRKTLETLGANYCTIMVGSVLAVDYASMKKPLVLFAYNPFGPEVWEQLLPMLEQKGNVIIYNNDLYRHTFLGTRWRKIADRHHKFPIGQFSLWLCT